MFRLSRCLHGLADTHIPGVGRHVGEGLRYTNEKFEIGHRPDAIVSRFLRDVLLNYGRQFSKMTWSTQRATRFRSFSLRTVHVSNGSLHSACTRRGGPAGKSWTE